MNLQMRGDPDLDAMARRVIDGNHYMTLATLDRDGRPRLSPVYYTAARYSDFYWVSSPAAHHSRNLAEHPHVQIVIFDSAAPVGQGEAVYLQGAAKQIDDEELDAVLPEAFRTDAGARRLDADQLRGLAPFRLYVAHTTSCEVHVPGGHPTHGCGVDTRQPADPTSTRAHRRVPSSTETRTASCCATWLRGHLARRRRRRRIAEPAQSGDCCVTVKSHPVQRKQVPRLTVDPSGRQGTL